MIELADVVVGLSFGDEGKGKITSILASKKNDDGTNFYSMVARWAGGNNAGHTVYLNGKKYKTHLIPSGVFYGVKSIIGPACVVHPKSLYEELKYLEDNGFDTSLVKVSPKAHIITDEHIRFDKENLAKKLGTTGRGIAPCYSDKAARVGLLAKDVLDKSILWDEKLEGNLLCEGAQGIWLDLDHGLYPYVTSSVTLSYGACSIGFAPQLIRDIWGIAKIYDTKSGEDPRFPDSLFEDDTLSRLADLGQEFGVTTGRRRKVNWLNLDMLISAVNLSGTTMLVLNKCDILESLNVFKLYYKNNLIEFRSILDTKEFIREKITKNCRLVNSVLFSESPEEL